MNQALNNSKFAHYCYLAMPHSYSDKERMTAAELGIGLLEIGGRKRVRMESQSRRFEPSNSVLREFLRKNLAIAQCAICQNFTNLYDIPKGQNREGGGWRKNVFATDGRWTYFCNQCRQRFENLFTRRRMLSLEAQVHKLQGKYAVLRNRIKESRRRTK